MPAPRADVVRPAMPAGKRPSPTSGTPHAPSGLAAIGAWLRSAYSDLRYEVCEILHDGDRAMAQAVMSGRQPGRSSPSPTPADRWRCRRPVTPSRSGTLTTFVPGRTDRVALGGS